MWTESITLISSLTRQQKIKVYVLIQDNTEA